MTCYNCGFLENLSDTLAVIKPANTCIHECGETSYRYLFFKVLERSSRKSRVQSAPKEKVKTEVNTG